MTMKDLTRAEEDVMQVLWQMEKGFVRELIEKMPEPRPAYNTVSTIIRILEKKKFVAHETFGKSHRYYPLIGKDAYSEYVLNKHAKNYFGGSFKSMLSFFAKKKDLNLKEFEELLAQTDQIDDDEKK